MCSVLFPTRTGSLDWLVSSVDLVSHAAAAAESKNRKNQPALLAGVGSKTAVPGFYTETCYPPNSFDGPVRTDKRRRQLTAGLIKKRLQCESSTPGSSYLYAV